jgi:hypothetical protein
MLERYGTPLCMAGLTKLDFLKSPITGRKFTMISRLSPPNLPTANYDEFLSQLANEWFRGEIARSYGDRTVSNDIRRNHGD